MASRPLTGLMALILMLSFLFIHPGRASNDLGLNDANCPCESHCLQSPETTMLLHTVYKDETLAPGVTTRCPKTTEAELRVWTPRITTGTCSEYWESVDGRVTQPSPTPTDTYISTRYSTAEGIATITSDATSYVTEYYVVPEGITVTPGVPYTDVIWVPTIITSTQTQTLPYNSGEGTVAVEIIIAYSTGKYALTVVTPGFPTTSEPLITASLYTPSAEAPHQTTTSQVPEPEPYAPSVPFSEPGYEDDVPQYAEPTTAPQGDPYGGGIGLSTSTVTVTSIVWVTPQGEPSGGVPQYTEPTTSSQEEPYGGGIGRSTSTVTVTSIVWVTPQGEPSGGVPQYTEPTTASQEEPYGGGIGRSTSTVTVTSIVWVTPHDESSGGVPQYTDPMTAPPEESSGGGIGRSTSTVTVTSIVWVPPQQEPSDGGVVPSGSAQTTSSITVVPTQVGSDSISVSSLAPSSIPSVPTLISSGSAAISSIITFASTPAPPSITSIPATPVSSAISSASVAVSSIDTSESTPITPTISSIPTPISSVVSSVTSSDVIPVPVPIPAPSVDSSGPISISPIVSSAPGSVVASSAPSVSITASPVVSSVPTTGVPAVSSSRTAVVPIISSDTTQVSPTIPASGASISISSVQSVPAPGSASSAVSSVGGQASSIVSTAESFISSIVPSNTTPLSSVVPSVQTRVSPIVSTAESSMSPITSTAESPVPSNVSTAESQVSPIVSSNTTPISSATPSVATSVSVSSTPVVPVPVPVPAPSNISSVKPDASSSAPTNRDQTVGQSSVAASSPGTVASSPNTAVATPSTPGATPTSKSSVSTPNTQHVSSAQASSPAVASSNPVENSAAPSTNAPASASSSAGVTASTQQPSPVTSKPASQSNGASQTPIPVTSKPVGQSNGESQTPSPVPVSQSDGESQTPIPVGQSNGASQTPTKPTTQGQPVSTTTKDNPPQSQTPQEDNDNDDEDDDDDDDEDDIKKQKEHPPRGVSLNNPCNWWPFKFPRPSWIDFLCDPSLPVPIFFPFPPFPPPPPPPTPPPGSKHNPPPPPPPPPSPSPSIPEPTANPTASAGPTGTDEDPPACTEPFVFDGSCVQECTSFSYSHTNGPTSWTECGDENCSATTACESFLPPTETIWKTRSCTKTYTETAFCEQLCTKVIKPETMISGYTTRTDCPETATCTPTLVCDTLTTTTTTSYTTRTEEPTPGCMARRDSIDSHARFLLAFAALDSMGDSTGQIHLDQGNGTISRGNGTATGENGNPEESGGDLGNGKPGPNDNQPEQGESSENGESGDQARKKQKPSNYLAYKEVLTSPKTWPNGARDWWEMVQEILFLNSAGSPLLVSALYWKDKYAPNHALFSPFAEVPVATGVNNLLGCVSVIIATDNGVYHAYFWEKPTFANPEMVQDPATAPLYDANKAYEDRVTKFLKEGSWYGTMVDYQGRMARNETSKASPSLVDLASGNGPFAKDMYTWMDFRIIMPAPSADPTTLVYPNTMERLQSDIAKILNVPVSSDQIISYPNVIPEDWKLLSQTTEWSTGKEQYWVDNAGEKGVFIQYAPSVSVDAAKGSRPYRHMRVWFDKKVIIEKRWCHVPPRKQLDLPEAPWKPADTPIPPDDESVPAAMQQLLFRRDDDPEPMVCAAEPPTKICTVDVGQTIVPVMNPEIKGTMDVIDEDGRRAHIQDYSGIHFGQFITSPPEDNKLGFNVTVLFTGDWDKYVFDSGYACQCDGQNCDLFSPECCLKGGCAVCDCSADACSAESPSCCQAGNCRMMDQRGPKDYPFKEWDVEVIIEGQKGVGTTDMFPANDVNCTSSEWNYIGDSSSKWCTTYRQFTCTWDCNHYY